MSDDDQPFLPGFPEPDPQAFARHDDPETSHEAAESVDPSSIRENQFLILCCLNAIGPQDDPGIAQWWSGTRHEPISPSGLRTRRSEVVARGLVQHSGEYGRSSSGRRTRLWELTDAGRRVLLERPI